MKILLCISGGIATYKICDVISIAKKRIPNVEFRTIMTKNAVRFVTPLTFEALTNSTVTTSTFDDPLHHISWAKWCDICCVAPLTANTLAKLALGICDDMLTTTVSAIPESTPVLFAPAMNTEMWKKKTIQKNVQILEDMGYIQIHPIEKLLACGDYGVGALAEATEIVNRIKILHQKR